MKHGFSDADWVRYLGGAMPEEEVARMRARIEPRQAREQLAWHLRISREAAALRWVIQLPDEQLTRLLSDALARLEAGADRGPAHGRSALESMLLMQSLLEPIFGAGAARAAMGLAVRRCSSSSCDGLESCDWALFVSTLSKTMSALCGSAAGRRVSCAGVSLAAGGQ
jgi:hypothetical protein